jgi:deferrochelatase/peroxidase EfeB
LNDVGANSPANWEKPFGTSDFHVALAVYSATEDSLEQVLRQARIALHELPGISVVYRLEFHELPGGRNPFGFRDGLHNPEVEGSGNRVYPGYGKPIKAGEFVLGYPDELGATASAPEPEALRLNGTFVAFRKLDSDSPDWNGPGNLSCWRI